MSAAYRLTSKHVATPMEALSDARSCVRWVMLQFGKLGLEPAQLFLAGASAGGQLAVASLLTAAFDDPHDCLEVEPSAKGLILFNPVLDAGPEGYGYAKVKDVWKDFSPLHALEKPLPPILILSGVEDETTPIQGMRAFRDKAVALGGQCEIKEYEGQAHGFFNHRDGKNPYYSLTLKEVFQFLEQQV